MRSTVSCVESAEMARWAAATPPSVAVSTQASNRRRIIEWPRLRVLARATRELRLWQCVELGLLRRGQDVTDGGEPLICFLLIPFHFRTHAVHLHAHFRRRLLPWDETALHLLAQGLTARGDVLHHPVEGRVGLRHLGFLLRRQGNGLSE